MSLKTRLWFSVDTTCWEDCKTNQGVAWDIPGADRVPPVSPQWSALRLLSLPRSWLPPLLKSLRHLFRNSSFFSLWEEKKVSKFRSNRPQWKTNNSVLFVVWPLIRFKILLNSHFVKNLFVRSNSDIRYKYSEQVSTGFWETGFWVQHF